MIYCRPVGKFVSVSTTATYLIVDLLGYDYLSTASNQGIKAINTCQRVRAARIEKINSSHNLYTYFAHPTPSNLYIYFNRKWFY